MRQSLPVSAETGTIGAPPASCRQPLADFLVDEVEPIGVDRVHLGEDDHAALDLEQIEDRQVLDGLRHRPFVGGDDEQRGVDAADAGQHVLDEPLVTGDVDDADRLPVRQRQPGETEVDRHRPRLFLGQAIGIDAGERLYEGRLAVVDVSGRADHEGTRRISVGSAAETDRSPANGHDSGCSRQWRMSGWWASAAGRQVAPPTAVKRR